MHKFIQETVFPLQDIYRLKCRHWLASWLWSPAECGNPQQDCNAATGGQQSSQNCLIHHHTSVVPPGAVSCKFDRILPFWSNHAVNAPYSCSFLSKFESQTCPSFGKRLGCASALDTVLLFVLCMHSAKPVQNIQLSPQIREFVLSHFTGCFLLWKKRKRNFISDEGE